MGVRLPTVASNSPLVNIPANGAETALVTTPPLNISLDSAQVIIFWTIEIQIGTGVTAVLFRVRRGNSIIGVSVSGSVSATAVAGNAVYLSHCLVDTPGIIAGQQYTLTGSATGSTGVSTTQEATIIAIML